MNKSFATIIIMLSIVSCKSTPPPLSGLEGKTIPDFPLLLVDSSSHFRTGSISEGKPTVLFYFLPNCPYCRAQMTSIIQHKDGLKNIQFILVTTAPYSELKQFYTKYDLSKYPNITAGIDQSLFFSEYFSTDKVPFIAIYDKSRKLKQASVGKMYTAKIKQVAEQ